MKRKHPFNMIEIMLALGVCAIGITSIMVLFPVGSAATRDAAMETYAAHAADQMLHMLKYQMIQPPNPSDNWAAKIGASGTLPNGNPAQDPDPDASENQAITSDDPDWNSMAESEMNTIFGHSTNGIYQVISDRGTTSPSLSSDTVDFRAIMFVWWSDISILGTGNEDVGVTLNVEVTWPAELPYDRRQKAYYALEVFNPNYTP